jgi:geranylgeranyl diphosphate synthase, type II
MAPSISRISGASTSAATFDAEREIVERALAALCDRHLRELAAPVGEAIRYSLLGGGKRFRGILFLAGYQAAGGRADAGVIAASIEIVHAYSLVHDDLPCMDDDDMRRGRPTVHRAFGVRAATAAGVAMVPLAVLAALEGAADVGLSAREGARIVAELMRASGAGGMIGGQLLDLEGEGRSLSLAELERVHRGKTGALIATSAALGGFAANASEPRISALRLYGEALGLAFQIADDVLDVTETTAVLGKTAGRDVELNKSTYPALLGIQGAIERAEALIAQGCTALSGEGLLTPALERLAQFIVLRRS